MGGSVSPPCTCRGLEPEILTEPLCAEIVSSLRCAKPRTDAFWAVAFGLAPPRGPSVISQYRA